MSTNNFSYENILTELLKVGQFSNGEAVYQLKNNKN